MAPAINCTTSTKRQLYLYHLYIKYYHVASLVGDIRVRGDIQYGIAT